MALCDKDDGWKMVDGSSVRGGFLNVIRMMREDNLKKLKKNHRVLKNLIIWMGKMRLV